MILSDAKDIGRQVRLWLGVVAVITVLTTNKPIISSIMTNAGYLTWTGVGIRQYQEGKLLTDSVELEKAAVYWNLADKFQGTPSVMRGKAIWLAAKGRRSEAISFWKQGGFTEFRFIRYGETFQEQHKFVQALDAYRWAIDISPRFGDAWFYVGLVYQDMKNWNDALRAFGMASSMPRKHVEPGPIYYHLGRVELHLNHKDASLSYYTQAIPYEKQLSKREQQWLYFYRGTLLVNLGQYALARKSFESVLNIYPPAAPYYAAYVHLGLLAWQSERNFDSAKQYLLKAIDFMPDRMSAYFSLGRVYQESGHIDDARKMYQQITNLAPGTDDADRAAQVLKTLKPESHQD